jgi:hypothetical protein
MPSNPRDSDRSKRRPQRPAAPKPLETSAPDAHDDDAVIVPPPDPSVFAAAVARHARAHTSQRAARLGLRRTLIPILLTCGVMLPTLAVLWLRLEPEDPLRAGTGTWTPLVLAGLGLLLLAIGILHMLQVRHLLRAEVNSAYPPR